MLPSQMHRDTPRCVDVDKALCVRVHVHCIRAPCPRVSIVCACPPSCNCPAHTCTQVLFARGCHASSVCMDLSPMHLAYGLLGGCAQAPLKMWVDSYHYWTIYSTRWALIRFGDICVPAGNCIGGYALTIPPCPYPPLLPSATSSPVSSLTGYNHWGGTLPLNHGRTTARLAIDARQWRLWLTSCKLLPSPYTAETSHLSFHPHNTLACNHPPPHTPTLHTACQRPG